MRFAQEFLRDMHGKEGGAHADLQRCDFCDMLICSNAHSCSALALEAVDVVTMDMDPCSS